jgi:hypothetical protein
MDLPPPILAEGRTEPRDGWFQTWRDDSATDGIFWKQGYKMGRAWQYWDGRWMWVSWCRHGGHGLVATKEEAKRMIEEKADLANMSISCMPARDHRAANRQFKVARTYWREAG